MEIRENRTLESILSTLFHKTEQNFKSLIKESRKLSYIFLINRLSPNLGDLIMRLTDSLLLHILAIATTTEEHAPSIIVREDTEAMTVMVALFEAGLTEVGVLVG